MASVQNLVARVTGAVQQGDKADLKEALVHLRDHLESSGEAFEDRDAFAILDAMVSGDALGVQGAAEEVLPANSSLSTLTELANLQPMPPLERWHEVWETVDPILKSTKTRFSDAKLAEILEAVRDARQFEILSKLCDRLMSRGNDTPTVRQYYAQALIDSGNIRAGMHLLEALLQIPALTPRQKEEAFSLLGRANKQIYVNHVNAHPDDPAVRHRYSMNMRAALNHYGQAYAVRKGTFPGINIVVLLMRAERDGVLGPTTYNAQDLAREIIENLKTTHVPIKWDDAVRGEAHFALGQIEKARSHYQMYTRNPDVTLFDLASTTRQLEEVWGVDAASGEHGGQIVAELKEALANKSHGKVVISNLERAQIHRDSKDITEQQLLEGKTPGGKYLPFARLKQIVHTGRAVAVIRDQDGYPRGTGFAVLGSQLCPALGNEVFLMTNQHVMFADKENHPNAMHVGEARVLFEADDLSGDVQTFRVEETIWESEVQLHDAILLRLDRNFSSTFLHRTIRVNQSAENLRTIDHGSPPGGAAGHHAGHQHATATPVAVLGHPNGEPLQLSLKGSLLSMQGCLVDRGPRSRDGADPIYLHYDTPTEPGNSGSPVLETKTWSLIGLHHAGFPANGRAKLNGKTGTSIANEGICIQSIRKAIEGSIAPQKSSWFGSRPKAPHHVNGNGQHPHPNARGF